MFHNVGTIHKHSHDLSHDLNVQATNVLCIAETHLRPKTTLKNLTEIFPFAYHNHPIHNQNQPEAKHGTSIFAKIQLETVNHYNTNTLEATTAYDPIRKIHIVCVYRFPSSSIPKFVEDLKLIPATLTDEKKVIMGDFIMNTHGKNQQAIANICKELRTQQLVKEPTTKHNTVIDHIHTNIKDYRAASVLKTYYSDHDQIFIQL